MTTLDAPALRLDRHGAAAWITLNRPKAMNALSRSVLDRLNLALDEITADPAIRVVVLTGAGRRSAPARTCGGGRPDRRARPADVAEFVAYARAPSIGWRR